MFDHVSIGVADISRSKKFYDAALKPLGYSRSQRWRDLAGLRRQGGRTVARRHQQAREGRQDSGLHFCFVAKDRAAVDAFHAAALKAGGTDNGKPGLRADYGPKYYAAFAIDPDGYRLEAHCGT